MRSTAALLLACPLLSVPIVAQTEQDPPPPKVGEVKRAIRHAGGENITLPPRRVESGRGEISSVKLDFEIDIRRLRQAMGRDEARQAAALARIARHPAAADKAMQQLPAAPRSMLKVLTLVVSRLGSTKHAPALRVLLESRKLNQATGAVLAAYLRHAGPAGRESLFRFLESRSVPLRRAAQAELRSRLTEADALRLLRLARHRQQDVQRRALELMAGLQDLRLRRFLVERLDGPVVVARTACRTLISMGRVAAAELRSAAQAPGRGWSLAALALLETHADAAELPLPKALMPRLQASLAQGQGVAAVLAAAALAEASWRGELPEDAARDRRIVNLLLDVVAPERFVSGLSLLKPSAHRALARISGVDHGGRTAAWRSWWAGAREDFVALRRSLTVDAGSSDRGQLHWRAGEVWLIFHGPAARPAKVPEAARAYVLAAADFQALLADLRRAGFMAAGADSQRPGEAWQLELRLGARRVLQRWPARVPGGPHPAAAIQNRLTELARAELWQQHRPAAADPVEFWRSRHAEFRAGASGREAALVQLILASVESRDAAGRQRALDDLLAVPKLARFVDARAGARLVAKVADLQELSPSDFRMLEIALLVPGDGVWREALNAIRPHVEGAGDQLTSRFFALLGPERLSLAVLHPDPGIAVAAMHDVARNKLHSATRQLRRRLAAKQLQVVSTAVYALGMLRAKESSADLLAMEPKAGASLRREIWKALARIDVPECVPLLRRAARSRRSADQIAALAAMGYSRRPELANLLAARLVAVDHSEGGMASRRAELSLRQMGPLLAIKALRPHLQMQAGPELDRLVLLLGSFQDATVVPQLIEMLRRPKLAPTATVLLGETTGLDLGPLVDRPRQLTAWYNHRGRAGQASWFVDAVTLAQAVTFLSADKIKPDAAPEVVLELSRLLTYLQQPHLRVLCAALLRQCTGQDYNRGLRHADSARLRSIADRYKYHARVKLRSGR